MSLGLDIGKYSIKIVELEQIKDELKKGKNVQGARLIQETRLDIK